MLSQEKYLLQSHELQAELVTFFHKNDSYLKNDWQSVITQSWVFDMGFFEK